LSDQTKQPLLFTGSGNRIVGATIRGDKGNLFFLPTLKTDTSEFVRHVRGELNWTSAATKFGKQLLSCFAELHGTLISLREENPAPAWTMESAYKLSEEPILEDEIKKIDNAIGKLQKDRKSLASRIEIAGAPRRLLYEKGKPLEKSVVEALRLMGFKAEPFQNAESEFDVVFVSAEGRFLGEAEGKDNKPVNIDKLSQLERNISEDFEREGVTEHAHGVLFGNAYRLLPVKERGEFFATKCLSGAKRNGTALVRTPDLFEVMRYLKSTPDEEFATLCRKAIMDANGKIVSFPAAPNADLATQGSTIVATDVTSTGSKEQASFNAKN
jgi:hypothetical protein